jgi:hypothetical protein
VDPGDQHQLTLSTDDIVTLRVGLHAYLRSWAEHRSADGGATHPEEEWQALKREVGQLLWRLEEAMGSIVHSEEAVTPDGA